MLETAFNAELIDYCLSGHAYIHVPTPERFRLVDELVSIAEELNKRYPNTRRRVLVWSAANGWREAGNVSQDSISSGPCDPQAVPAMIADGKMPSNSFYVLIDFGTYVKHQSYNFADLVLSGLYDVRASLAGEGKTVIFAGTDFEIPPNLSYEITTVEYPLPDRIESGKALRYAVSSCDVVHGESNKKVVAQLLDESVLPELTAACAGMTVQQIMDRTALALRKYKRIGHQAVDLMMREKTEIVRRTGLLTYREPTAGGLDLIGGWYNVKQHVMRDKPCFRDDARQFGIGFPRGLLLVGIPGCGKTQMSLCIASYLGLPLIQMDVGSLMSKWVGESEQNMRESLRILERLAPCVLQIDEIEKGFAGIGGGTEDGGASVRTFGTFLKWLSDRTCPVYVIATANNIQSLPPEFTRKGRFDEIYGVYLPNQEEREEIFKIHLAACNRELPTPREMADLVACTDGYSGADIREVVQMALKIAYSDDKRRESERIRLSFASLAEAAGDVRPLSRTDPASVSRIEDWLRSHTKAAGGTLPDSITSGKKQRRVITGGTSECN